MVKRSNYYWLQELSFSHKSKQCVKLHLFSYPRSVQGTAVQQNNCSTVCQDKERGPCLAIEEATTGGNNSVLHRINMALHTGRGGSTCQVIKNPF